MSWTPGRRATPSSASSRAGPLQAGRPRAHQEHQSADAYRLPRYARDKVGTIELIHGCHAYPDLVATDRGDDPQWLYTVVFDGREIWGPDTDPTLTISIDAFEPYLEPA